MSGETVFRLNDHYSHVEILTSAFPPVMTLSILLVATMAATLWSYVSAVARADTSARGGSSMAWPLQWLHSCHIGLPRLCRR